MITQAIRGHHEKRINVDYRRTYSDYHSLQCILLIYLKGPFSGPFLHPMRVTKLKQIFSFLKHGCHLRETNFS